METNNRKGNTVLLTVIAIATLLVAIVGATFAYFTAAVGGNESASSIIVNTATIGTITFKDGNEINMKDALPGTEMSKEFSITTDTTSDSGVKYSVQLVIDENTFAVGSNDLVYTLMATNTVSNGGSMIAGSDAESAKKDLVITGTKGSTMDLGAGIIKQSEEHKYKFIIRFREMGSDQNSNQGKQFIGHLQVTTSGSDSNSLYYNSANPSGTEEMPSSDAGTTEPGE